MIRMKCEAEVATSIQAGIVEKQRREERWREI